MMKFTLSLALVVLAAQAINIKQEDKQMDGDHDGEDMSPGNAFEAFEEAEDIADGVMKADTDGDKIVTEAEAISHVTGLLKTGEVKRAQVNDIVEFLEAADATDGVEHNSVTHENVVDAYMNGWYENEMLKATNFIEEVWSHCDANEDGVLTVAEVVDATTAAVAAGDLSAEDAEELHGVLQSANEMGGEGDDELHKDEVYIRWVAETVIAPMADFAFENADVDGDDIITAAEAGDALDRAVAEGFFSEEEAAEISGFFEAADVDSSESVTREEFENGMLREFTAAISEE